MVDLIEEFSEGRVQFAYVKVTDPNTGLPKNVLIAWCGEGVPERTKGYFTSHLASVSKFLHVSLHPTILCPSHTDLVDIRDITSKLPPVPMEISPPRASFKESPTLQAPNTRLSRRPPLPPPHLHLPPDPRWPVSPFSRLLGRVGLPHPLASLARSPLPSTQMMMAGGLMHRR